MKAAAEARLTPPNQEGEAPWPVAPPSPSDLPDGEYIVAFLAHTIRSWFGQRKIRLTYEIIDPAQYAGIEVGLFATMGKRISRRSKFYALWVRANGGLPSRGDRMSPRVFRGYWRVRIAWSAPAKCGYAMPMIVELIERVAGGGG